MAITRAGTRITIQFDTGDPKGGSFTTPYTLADVLEASVSGGWDPAITKVGTIYFIPYSLYISPGTYFVMSQTLATTGESIHFNPIAPTDSFFVLQYWIYPRRIQPHRKY